MAAVGALFGLVTGPFFRVTVYLVLRGMGGPPRDTGGLWSDLLQMTSSGALNWSLLGALTGAGLGVMLLLTDRNRVLKELPLWRMGLLGGVVGAGFALGAALLSGSFSILFPSWIAGAIGFSGVVGAGLTTAMVVVAKRVERRELAIVGEARGLLEGDASENRGSPSSGMAVLVRHTTNRGSRTDGV